MSRGDILTLNVGSSSIKFALFALDQLEVPRHTGQVSGLGAEAPRGSQGGSHEEALAEVMAQVRAARAQVRAVGHRIVHGGTRFTGPVPVDEAVLQAIAALQPLAPLHQPHGLAGLRLAMQAWPRVPQVACFDTAFHRAMPALNQRFALPQALHDAGIQRYGFHGLSYESIRDQLQRAHPALARGRVVVAHLGNGASMCALHALQPVATTMSFSPLDGLTMGTRCGRLDAAVVLHLWQQRGMAAAEVEALLHRQSGLLGLSGLSADMRELQAAAAPGNAAQLAIDHFVEQALRELAGMAAALRGLDGLVFTGGIGENAAPVRAAIVQGAAWLGLSLDAAANARGTGGLADTRAAGLCISTADSRVPVHVLRTCEEAVIARQTVAATAVAAAA